MRVTLLRRAAYYVYSFRVCYVEQPQRLSAGAGHARILVAALSRALTTRRADVRCAAMSPWSAHAPAALPRPAVLRRPTTRLETQAEVKMQPTASFVITARKRFWKPDHRNFRVVFVIPTRSPAEAGWHCLRTSS